MIFTRFIRSGSIDEKMQQRPRSNRDGLSCGKNVDFTEGATRQRKGKAVGETFPTRISRVAGRCRLVKNLLYKGTTAFARV